MNTVVVLRQQQKKSMRKLNLPLPELQLDPDSQKLGSQLQNYSQTENKHFNPTA